MDYVILNDQRRVVDTGDTLRSSLFETANLQVEQLRLPPGHSQPLHQHDADALYVVLEGEALFDIDDERELLSEGTAVLARAGVPHGVDNLSDSEVVLLVVTAPKPA